MHLSRLPGSSGFGVSLTKQTTRMPICLIAHQWYLQSTASCLANRLTFVISFTKRWVLTSLHLKPLSFLSIFGGGGGGGGLLHVQPLSPI